MHKKILVPLDGSQQAELILETVENMAKGFGASVLFLRVEEQPLMLGIDEVIDESTRRQQELQRKNIESYLIEIEKKFQRNGIATKHYVAYGSVVAALLTIAKKDDVDLIALASRGLNGSYQPMCRSTAARLLERSDFPVMVIRYNDENVI